MYDHYDKKQIECDRKFSTPPSDAMTIFNPELSNHGNLQDAEIQSNIARGLNPTGNLGYYVVFYCHDDIKSLKTQIANKRSKGLKIGELETEILKYSLAETYTKGNYPYTLSYRLPGKRKITSSFEQKLTVK